MTKNGMKTKDTEKKTRSIINSTPRANKDCKKKMEGSQRERKEKMNKKVPIKGILKWTGGIQETLSSLTS